MQDQPTPAEILTAVAASPVCWASTAACWT